MSACLLKILHKLIKCLFDLQKYQEQLTQDAHSLDAIIELLQHTSKLVSLFNDKIYISSTDDDRLQQILQVDVHLCR